MKTEDEIKAELERRLEIWGIALKQYGSTERLYACISRRIDELKSFAQFLEIELEED
jgi:hypothetical protein